MKPSLLLAAVLSIQAVFASPYPALEASGGKALVARVPGERSSSPHGGGNHRSSQGGYRSGGSRSSSGRSRQDTPDDRERVRQALAGRSPPRDIQFPTITDRDSSLSPGRSHYVDYRAPEGNPRTKIVFGSGEGRTHAKAMKQIEDKDSRAKEAVFRRATTPEHAAARKESLRGANRAGQLPGSGPAPKADREEKYPPASMKPKNKVAESMNVGVTYARRDESTRFDNPILRGALSKPGADRDFTFESSMRPEDDDGRDNGMNLKDTRGGRTELAKSKAEKTRAARRSDRGGDSGRSNSPEDDPPRRSHRVRSDDKDRRRGRKDDDEYRRLVKRDAVGQATHKQEQAESDHPDTTGDFKQEYQALMEAFNLVRTNATDIVMPIVEDLIDGSNAEVVWGMGWEILSLAEPSIDVTGSLFRAGLHACDWYEDLVANSTSEDEMTGLRAVNAVLIDLYQDAFTRAVDALDAAGVSVQLDQLVEALDTNDTSVANLNDDHTNTEYIIDFFAQLPNSTLIGLPPDDNSTSLDGFDNSTSLAGNDTLTTLVDDNSTALAGDDESTSGSTTAVSLPIDTSTAASVEPSPMPNEESDGTTGDSTASASAAATTLKAMRAINRPTATPASE
ncbi:MAG: hypothetical protein LQ350_006171 [Teloschistes chrysophthalmus]|nr:MAG: hypothetical protein LQ350_006171 [Niorma chrysophthalma]